MTPRKPHVGSRSQAIVIPSSDDDSDNEALLSPSTSRTAGRDQSSPRTASAMTRLHACPPVSKSTHSKPGRGPSEKIATQPRTFTSLAAARNQHTASRNHRHGGPSTIVLSDSEEDEIAVEQVVTTEADVKPTIARGQSSATASSSKTAASAQQDSLTIFLSRIQPPLVGYADAFRKCGIKGEADLLDLRSMSESDQKDLLQKMEDLCGMTYFLGLKFRAALRDYQM